MGINRVTAFRALYPAKCRPDLVAIVVTLHLLNSQHSDDVAGWRTWRRQEPATSVIAVKTRTGALRGGDCISLPSTYAHSCVRMPAVLPSPLQPWHSAPDFQAMKRFAHAAQCSVSSVHVSRVIQVHKRQLRQGAVPPKSTLSESQVAEKTSALPHHGDRVRSASQDAAPLCA
jgi:hypothetical protein